MFLSGFYLIDLVLMIILYGGKSVFLKRSYALRMEIVYIIAQVVARSKIKNDQKEDEVNIKMAAMIFSIVILFRNLRITSFLEELE